VIAVLVMTDGRQDYLTRTVLSALANLGGPISEWWMHDDTGDPDHHTYLRHTYPEFTHIQHDRRVGFTAAIGAAWSVLTGHSHADHVFHLEQDFTLNRDVDLGELAEVLTARPDLVQMALRRQACNEVEVAAGGVVETDPGAYLEQSDDSGRHWLEHRLWFTTNPSLYRRTLTSLTWPQLPHSEQWFSMRLLAGGTPEAAPDEVRFGYWGARDSGPWVEHIGLDRVGRGY
jgi:hypothetical protein